MTITQEITEYSGDLPDKETMTPDEFDVAAEAWVEYQDGIAAEINTWAAQANAVGVSVADLVTALAAANFKGAWSDLTGALAMPACVYHDSQYWMLLDDLADVTASEPSDTNADWALFPLGTNIIAKIADYTITAAQMRAGNVIFTNEGASGEVEFDLPARSGDFKAAFMTVASQYLKLNPPSGEKLYFFNNQETAADGYIRTNVPRTYFKVIGTASVGYTITELFGNLNVDE